MDDINAKYLDKLKKIGGKQGLNFLAELDSTILEQVEKLKENKNSKNYPLLGIPILLKDNIDVKGLHTTAGSLALEDNIAENDAPVVRTLREKGAIILGKTNMTEFANYTTKGMPGGYSSRGGQVIHAINKNVSPSGSSSGSGVAVSSGIVDVAIGTDTSFSTVACALDNGICGLKPPVGTLSNEGIIPIARTLDSVGIMANNLSNALLVYGALRDDEFGKELMHLSPTEISSLKFAVNTANETLVSKEQMNFLEKMQDKIRKKGGVLSTILQPPTGQLPIIMKYEFKTQLEDYLQKSNASLKTLKEIVDFYENHPDTMKKYGDSHLIAALNETGEGLEDDTYKQAMAEREELRKSVKEELMEYDAVIMTGPTYIMHLCGFPSLSIVSKTKNKEGVKRGIILYGVNEVKLYKAALALEKILLS